MKVCFYNESVSENIYTKYQISSDQIEVLKNDYETAEYIVFTLSHTLEALDLFVLGYLVAKQPTKLIVCDEGVGELSDCADILDVLKRKCITVLSSTRTVGNYLNSISIKPLSVLDFVLREQADFDIIDTTCDDLVSVIYLDLEDPLIKELLSKVSFVEKTGATTAVADWSGFIKSNQTILHLFAVEHWIDFKTETDEDFIQQWITEIQLILAGYLSKNASEDLYRLLTEIK